MDVAFSNVLKQCVHWKLILSETFWNIGISITFKILPLYTPFVYCVFLFFVRNYCRLSRSQALNINGSWSITRLSSLSLIFDQYPFKLLSESRSSFRRQFSRASATARWVKSTLSGQHPPRRLPNLRGRSLWKAACLLIRWTRCSHSPRFESKSLPIATFEGHLIWSYATYPPETGFTLSRLW